MNVLVENSPQKAMSSDSESPAAPQAPDAPVKLFKKNKKENTWAVSPVFVMILWLFATGFCAAALFGFHARLGAIEGVMSVMHASCPACPVCPSLSGGTPVYVAGPRVHVPSS